MDQSIIFFFASIIVIAALLFFLICITKRGSKHLDVEKYRVKWLSVEQQLKKDEISSYHLSVLNADKLVDQALRERGIKGQTMGERMKNSVNLFSDRNGIWTAHKLRNKIAHETDARVTYDEARLALGNFKKALKDLGAI
ncbi:MAG: hypothetical protein PWQ10_595 [Patescibacteria group bacterium]|nr:hypothetical protein [Patescibacteria group bacterium]